VDSIELTDAEVIDAFSDALGIEECEIDQNAKTAVELSELLNISYSNANRRINAALKAGKMERVKKYIEAVDGRKWLASAYRVVQ
jgi:hypothetical protein